MTRQQNKKIARNFIKQMLSCLVRRVSKYQITTSLRSFAAKAEKKVEEGIVFKEKKPLSEKMIEHNAEKEAKKASDVYKRKVGGKYIEAHEHIVKHPEDQNTG